MTDRYQCETCGEVPISGPCPHGCDSLTMCRGCRQVPTDEGLCETCFAALPMGEWVTVPDDFPPVLCGECSDDLGDPGEWWDAVRELAPADRLPCRECGA